MAVQLALDGTHSSVISTGAMSDEIQSPHESKHRRKSHKKVKTGCLTCKIRRKKCDETRPFCIRCTSTGRKCDGYTPLPESDGSRSLVHLPPAAERLKNFTDNSDFSSTKSVISGGTSYPPNDMSGKSPNFLPSNYSSLTIYKPFQLQLHSADESHCFDFFRDQTGPGFAGYFDSSSWSGFMLRACYNQPTVLKAILALGAAHRRHQLGISPEAFSLCDLSAKLAQKATLSWRNDIKSGQMRPEINLVLAKLFATFETFQGNHEIAAKFMIAAFQVLVRQPAKPLMIETHRVDAQLNNQTLRQFFLGIEHQMAALFGCSVETIWQNLKQTDQREDMPLTFATMEQARDLLLSEVRQIWLLPNNANPGKQYHSSDYKQHLGRLMQWSASYTEHAKLRLPRHDHRLRRVGKLLKWYREAAFLQLLLQTTSMDPIDKQMVVYSSGTRHFLTNSLSRTHCECQISLGAHFARLQLLADWVIPEGYMDEDSPLDGSLTTGLSFHVGSTNCRSSSIYRQMTGPIADTAGQQTAWDTAQLYTIAGRISQIESDATTSVSDGLTPDWVDITYFVEGKKVCLIYCKLNEKGSGLDWIREWFDLS